MCIKIGGIANHTFLVGERVRSRTNEIANRAGLTYTVKKVNKTTVWVETNDERKVLYKDVSPSVLERV
jgi:hypothetical protein